MDLTIRELKKLKREELLEIMLAQSREIDNLRAQLDKAEEANRERELKILTAGSLAEASLSLTKVFEAAQKAADLYLYNVKRMAGVPEEAPNAPNAAPDFAQQFAEAWEEAPDAEE